MRVCLKLQIHRLPVCDRLRIKSFVHSAIRIKCRVARIGIDFHVALIHAVVQLDLDLCGGFCFPELLRPGLVILQNLYSAVFQDLGFCLAAGLATASRAAGATAARFRCFYCLQPMRCSPALRCRWRPSAPP